ncbi:MAG: hypothetical protein H8D45_31190 [Bacteroidetes bacterium]|nr:hypothetical protein [Bacteroidota bacterium]MBL7103278.1 hypothetical protein [Bacteroidales bacterium]
MKSLKFHVSGFRFSPKIFGVRFQVCHVKCDACPVKFEVRKYFSREGAYFIVVQGNTKPQISNLPDYARPTGVIRAGLSGGNQTSSCLIRLKIIKRL